MSTLLLLLVLSVCVLSATSYGVNTLRMCAPKPSGIANTKEGKTIIVERTKKLLASSNIVLSLPFEKVTKEQIDMLKKEIPKVAKASVVKNTLFRKAAIGTKFEAMNDKLSGETLYFFIPEGESKPTYAGLEKWLKEVKRTDPEFAPKIAVMENTLYTGASIKAVVNLPTKKELITKIAQGIKAVPTKVARGVKAVPNKLGRAIAAIKEQKEKQEA